MANIIHESFYNLICLIVLINLILPKRFLFNNSENEACVTHFTHTLYEVKVGQRAHEYCGLSSVGDILEGGSPYELKSWLATVIVAANLQYICIYIKHTH